MNLLSRPNSGSSLQPDGAVVPSPHSRAAPYFYLQAQNFGVCLTHTPNPPVDPLTRIQYQYLPLGQNTTTSQLLPPALLTHSPLLTEQAGPPSQDRRWIACSLGSISTKSEAKVSTMTCQVAQDLNLTPSLCSSLQRLPTHFRSRHLVSWLH